MPKIAILTGTELLQAYLVFFYKLFIGLAIVEILFALGHKIVVVVS